MVNETALKAEFTIKTIEGRIRDLTQALHKFAPNPRYPSHRDSLFIAQRGAGSFALGHHNAICNTFNGARSGNMSMREQIEGTIASLFQSVSVFKREYRADTLELCA